mgnify:FL=1
MGKKVPTSFSLSKDAIILIAELSEKLGLSKTSILELAIRRLAEEESRR